MLERQRHEAELLERSAVEKAAARLRGEEKEVEAARQAMTCKRLSNPPNYVPKYLRADSEDVADSDTQGAAVGRFRLETGDEGVFEMTFEETLARMYEQHRRKVEAKKKRARARKRDLANKVKEEKEAEEERLKNKTPAEQTNAEERAKKKKLAEDQRRNTARLSMGFLWFANQNAAEEMLSENNDDGTNNPVPEPKPKFDNTVQLKALRKEKEQLLNYLDRLQRPVIQSR